LDASGSRVVGVRVLESRNPKPSAPTTGAIRGASFYCIASGQLDALGDDGELKPGARLVDVSIFRAPLD
jgi:hypothetical protein